MEITTIVGIVIAIVIMAFGLKMILKKPVDSAPSLDSELQFNAESQKPIIPRHVRDQLQSDATPPRVEPTLTVDEVTQDAPAKSEPQALTDDVVASSSTETDKVEPSLQANTENSELDPSTTISKSEVAQDTLSPTATTAEYSLSDEIQQVIVETEPNAQTVEQNKASTESFIALNVLPERRILSGDKALKVLMKYGLRFGEMSCFHRYNEDGTKLLFSVLQINDEGADGFDLETLSSEQVKGLAFFLALPHSDVQNAFDTMVSISGLIAREIDGTVYDQNHLEFTPQLREHWRHQAIDYRAGQASHV